MFHTRRRYHKSVLTVGRQQAAKTEEEGLRQRDNLPLMKKTISEHQISVPRNGVAWTAPFDYLPSVILPVFPLSLHQRTLGS